ncbi:flippase [Natronomonas gomsonensis]|uniref:flippase n=1 Tax=Natronomonas gomsonensis TaxID=1046043 RepID=UPI0015B91D36|nr:flippase [Natronomonas gomsonensis]
MELAERLSRGVKATFGANILDVVANAVLIVVLARYLLTPEEYGLLYFALSVFGTVGILGTLGLPSSAARYVTEFAESAPGQVPHVMRVALGFLLALSVVVGTAVTLGGPWLAKILGDAELAPLLLLGIGYVVGESLRQYLTAMFQGLNRVSWSAVVRSVQAVGRVGFAVGFVLLGFGVVGALAGFVAASLASVVVGGVVFVRFYRSFPTADREEGIVRRLLEYSIPLTATRSASVIDGKVDTILVGVLLNVTAVGYYTIAKQIAQVCVTPASSLGFTISPAVGEQKAGNRADRAARLYEQALEYVLLLYVPAVVGLVLVAEPMVRYVFGQEYLGAVVVVQLLSVYVLAMAVVKITSDGLDFLGRARDRAIVKIIMALSNVVLNLLLIPIFGVAGAALATVVTFSGYTLANVYIISLELPIEFAGIARSLAGVTAVSLVMGAAVALLVPHVTGLLTLLGVVAVGAAIWLAGVAGGGLLDVRRAVSYLT